MDFMSAHMIYFSMKDVRVKVRKKESNMFKMNNWSKKKKSDFKVN